MRSQRKVRKWRILALLCVMALAAAACGDTDDEGDDTTVAPVTGESETTAGVITEAPGTNEDLFPWLAVPGTGEVRQIPAGVTVDSDLLGLGQAPCDECGAPNENAAPQYADRDPDMMQCEHQVSYEPNQLVLDSEEIDLDNLDVAFSDITPLLVGEDLDEPYQLPPGIVVVEVDPGTDLVAELVKHSPGQIALNYVYHPAPGWKFGPGAQPHKSADPGSTFPGMPFAGGSDIVVVDNFGQTTGIEEMHGEFIVSLLKDLTGADAEKVPIEFQNDGQGTWNGRDNDVAVAAAAHAAALKSPGSILNMSLGTYPCVVEGVPYPPLVVGREILDLLDGDPDSEEPRLDGVVAAAGNDSHGADGPLFYPAGFDHVTGVGALAFTGTEDQWVVAGFSNLIADKWAPGVAVAADVNGQTWQWSGTSFAAPIYAACLAAGRC